MFISSQDIASINEVVKEVTAKLRKAFKIKCEAITFQGVDDSFCRFMLRIPNPSTKKHELEVYTDDYTIINDADEGEFVLANFYY